MTRKLWLAAVLAASVAFPAIAEDASTKVAPEAARSGTPSLWRMRVST